MISPEEEIKRIYMRSVKLLDHTQSELEDLKQLLRKSVIRLSVAAKSENEQVNRVLEDIKETVRDGVDVSALEVQLDRLFVFVNQLEEHDRTAVNSSIIDFLTDLLGKFDFGNDTSKYTKRLEEAIAARSAEPELGNVLLSILDELAHDVVLGETAIERHRKAATDFADKINALTGFRYHNAENADVEVILGELASHVVQYIGGMTDTAANGIEQHNGDCNHSPELGDVLVQLVEQLQLPETTRDAQYDIINRLKCPVPDAAEWISLIDSTIGMINTGVAGLQRDKHDLQNFIKNITVQLGDIESYVAETRIQREDTVDKSIKLKDSVDASVQKINETVVNANDIDELKNDVQVHLKEIRRTVKEHKKAEEQKELISKQSYAHVIDELSRSRKETEKLKQQLEESKDKLLKDSLTGISNRIAYEERINLEYERWVRKGTPLCLAIWDIDRFKSINDSYGHDVGDRVLKIFADVINSRVRKVDTFARIGGEEFVLVMPDTPLDAGLMLNEKLREMLAACNFHYNDHQHKVTASVGLAAFEEGDTIETVKRHADIALYKSKNTGRNRCTVYEPCMSEPYKNIGA